MKQNEIIDALVMVFDDLKNDEETKNDLFARAKAKNAWFSIENLSFSLNEWTKSLNANNLNAFCSKYNFTENPKNIGIIMAGNIPMVGFHDLLCVLLSGHNAKVKLSSDDEVLIPFIAEQLIKNLPELSARIQFVERIKDVDAVIATGSDNTARYFHSYFGHLPNIIRKNRTSIAVLDGSESQEQLFELGKDIYTYFGLGCRNVTSLLIPENYNLSTLLTALEPYVYLMDHHKYANNYTYHKAIWLMDNTVHYDNGFMLFKEDTNLHAPLSTLFYKRYKDDKEVDQYLKEHQNQIQCIVSTDSQWSDIEPGNSQSPALNDYADQIDVMHFLNNL